jgi:hypothetical protein
MDTIGHSLVVLDTPGQAGKRSFRPFAMYCRIMTCPPFLPLCILHSFAWLFTCQLCHRTILGKCGGGGGGGDDDDGDGGSG